MHIAFITYEYPPDTKAGGIGSYTYQVARLLQTNGFNVDVFAGSHSRQNTFIEDGVTVHRILCADPADFQLKVFPFFKKIHAVTPFDIIESAEIHANADEIKKAYTGIPLIVRLHAPNYLVESYKKAYVPAKNKWRYFLGGLRRGKWDLGFWKKYDHREDKDYQFTKTADHITAPTQQMKEWIIQNWKLKEELITVIENPFLENTSFTDAITDNKEKAVIFFGRLSILKGLYTGTLAMKKVLKNNPSWKWIVVGDDGTAADGKSSMKMWMEKQLKEVISQVEFYGSLNHRELSVLLKRASIVLVPSLFESYSYVTIEAMCAGKAIIGSTGTGIASLITHNENGLLADPYKTGQWYQNIQQLINSESLRKQLGSAASVYTGNKNKVNEKIVSFYKTLINKTGQRSV